MSNKEDERLFAEFPPELVESLDRLAADMGVSTDDVRQRVLEVCAWARERLDDNKLTLGLAENAEVISLQRQRVHQRTLAAHDAKRQRGALARRGLSSDA